MEHIILYDKLHINIIKIILSLNSRRINLKRFIFFSDFLSRNSKNQHTPLSYPTGNIVFAFIMYIEFAKRFGRSALFGFFLHGLIPIGWFILAFGKDTYKKTPPKA
jgi:hypothetical protein